MYSILSTSVTVGFDLTASPAFWIFSLCLLGVFGFFVWTLIRQILFTKRCQNVQANLKVGDRVKTFGGIYGKVVDIAENPDGKVVTIETGDGKNVGYVTVDISSIYNLDTSQLSIQKHNKKLSK